MFVVVADSLQLAATRKLPDHKLEAAPQTFAVEEDEELGHHSGEEGKKKKEKSRIRLDVLTENTGSVSSWVSTDSQLSSQILCSTTAFCTHFLSH